MIRRVSSLLCIIILSLSASTLYARKKLEKSAAEKAALLTSFDRIHLDDPGSSWHMKATVQLVQQGQPGETGTVDVARDTHNEMRTIFDFPDFHQTVVTTKAGRFVAGDQGDAPGALNNFLRFYDNSASLNEINHAKLISFNLKRSLATFHCVLAVSKIPDPISGRHSFCNIIGSPALRYFSIGPTYVALLEQLMSFQGGDVPTKAVIFFQGAPIARLTLAFAPLYGADTMQMHPPANAVRVDPTETSKISALLNNALVIPFLTPSPVRIAPPEDGAVLLRIQLSGKNIKSIQTIATSDARTAKDIIAGVRKTIAATSIPPGDRFVNYAYRLNMENPNSGANANADLPDLDGLQ